MILGRQYTPVNRSIEVSKDPNKFLARRGTELPMRDDDENQAQFGPTKPDAGASRLKMKEGPPFHWVDQLTQEVAAWPAKSETIAAKPPTLDDFANIGKLFTEKYGQKVRITSLDLDASRLDKMMKMKIKVPKRDANDQVMFDGQGNMLTEEIEFGALFKKDGSAVQRMLLNSLNNIEQGIGPTAFLMLRTAFAKGYNFASDDEKSETFRNLLALDTTNYLANVNEMPYWLSSFYMQDPRDLQYLLKYRVFVIRRRAGAAIRQIDTDFLDNSFSAFEYNPFSAGSIRGQLLLVLTGQFPALPIKTVEELDSWYLENLLTGLSVDMLDWPAINANLVNGDQSRSPMYLLASIMMNGIEAFGGTYQAWYEAQAAIFLNAYSNAPAPIRQEVINRATAMTNANGADLTQIVRRNVLLGGIGGMIPVAFGGAVYTVPLLPPNRAPIRRA